MDTSESMTNEAAGDADDRLDGTAPGPRAGDPTASADDATAAPDGPADSEAGADAGGADAEGTDERPSEGAEGADDRPHAGDPRVALLQAELAAKDKQLRDFVEAYKTARQEMDNARARLERDKERELERMRARVTEQLVDVLDNLDRSVAGVRPGARIEDVQVGLQMVREQFFAVLAGYGLTAVPALGADFDTAVHEATGVVPAGPHQRDQEIIFVERAGYTFGGKLLRPARVLIAQRG